LGSSRLLRGIASSHGLPEGGFPGRLSPGKIAAKPLELLATPATSTIEQ
jgi:hypothetical protein